MKEVNGKYIKILDMIETNFKNIHNDRDLYYEYDTLVGHISMLYRSRLDGIIEEENK